MTTTRDAWQQALWGDRDPFFNVDVRLVDMQGSASEHDYLTPGVDELRPSVAVKIDVWKGESAMPMAHAVEGVAYFKREVESGQ